MLDLRTSAVVTLLVLSTAGSASAQSYGLLGSKGDLVIGAERLFGFLSTSTTTDATAGSPEQTDTVTQISLIAGDSLSPYATPRVTLDGLVVQQFSVGGTLGLANLSSSTEQMGMEADGLSMFAVVVGARAGYVYMFNETAGIWPHLGLTYFTASGDFGDASADEFGSSGLALSLDVTLVIMPISDFGFGIGPVLDAGLTGSTDYTPAGGSETSTDTTITDWGLQAGLFGRL